jgi:hypothetical protein
MLSGKLRKGGGGMMVRAFLYLGIAVMLGIFAVGFGPKVADELCVHRWKDSGLKARFTFGTGCMVEIENDRWIPQANVQIRP